MSLKAENLSSCTEEDVTSEEWSEPVALSLKTKESRCHKLKNTAQPPGTGKGQERNSP